MKNRLIRALEPVIDQFAYIIIDTPPTTGDLLINSPGSFHTYHYSC